MLKDSAKQQKLNKVHVTHKETNNANREKNNILKFLTHSIWDTLYFNSIANGMDNGSSLFSVELHL